MNSLHKKIPPLVSKTLKSKPRLPHFNHFSHFSKPDQAVDTTIVKAICDSFAIGSSWDDLSTKFRHLDFTEPLIERVLLELIKPVSARRALGFFHWSCREIKFQHGVRTYAIAIHILVKARMKVDAKVLMESVLKRGGSVCDCRSKSSLVESLLDSYWITGSIPYVFDLLVQCYSKMRMLEAGFEVCCYLEERGFCLSLLSYNYLLHFDEKSDVRVGLAWKIYEHMIMVRVFPNNRTARTLIGCLCKEGKLMARVEMLDQILGKRCSSPYVTANTSLIFGILEQGRVEDGLVLLKRMLTKKMVFDTIAYSFIIYAKIKLGELDSARELFQEMLQRGFQPNSFVHTVLIEGYCDDGRVDEAGLLMEEMEMIGMKPYNETFSALIKGYVVAGRLEESLNSFEKMLKMGFVPNCLAFNELVKVLCDNGDVEKADSTLTLVLDKGFVPNETTYARLIDGYANKSRVEVAIKLFYEMESKSLSPGPPVLSMLIKSACRAGELKMAAKFLEVMRKRSIVENFESLCDTLISSYIEKGDTERAEIVRSYFKGNNKTW